MHAAEIVYRRGDTRKLTGDISANQPKGILLKPTKGEPLLIPADEVQQVQWNGEPPSLRNARNDDLAGRIQKSIDGYQQALKEIEAARQEQRADASFGIAKGTALLANSDAKQIPPAIERLEEYRQKFPDNYHYWEATLWLSRIHLLKGDASAAGKVCRELRTSQIDSYVLAGEIGEARIMLSQKQPENALRAFEKASKFPAKGLVAEQQQLFARLGMAESYAALQKYPEALKVIDETLEKIPADDNRLLATTYLKRGDAYLALGKTKESVLSYLHVDVLFPDQGDAHAEALFRLSQLWGALNHPERGIQARERLGQLYPQSSWAKQGAH